MPAIRSHDRRGRTGAARREYRAHAPRYTAW
jgi:hypothetical protein